MASPQGGGMSGGPGQSQQHGQGQGQGLHTPAAVRPPPPGMVPPGLSPLPEGGMSGPHPIMTMSPGIGVSMGVNVGPVAGSEQPPKRKRGRPRKYSGGDSPGIGSGSPFSPIPITAAPSPYTPSEKRGRGRPPGSGKKQQLAALGLNSSLHHLFGILYISILFGELCWGDSLLVLLLSVLSKLWSVKNL